MEIATTMIRNVRDMASVPGVIATEQFGVRVPRPTYRKISSLSSQECIELFGEVDATAMNFIPMMLIEIALDQVEELVTYCAANHLADYRRHARELRNCINEYRREEREGMGSRIWGVYQGYLRRLQETVAGDLFTAWCTFTNEAARQYVGREHKDIPAKVAFIRLILSFVYCFDQNQNRRIGEKLHTLCSRRQNPVIVLVTALCVDIAETFGMKMETTENMKLCVKILANRCRQVTLDIIRAENPEVLDKR